MSNTAIDANETLRQLEMHIGWATGINKEACLAMCKELRTALSNAPEVVTLEAAEEIAQAGVPPHWQSPTSRSVIRHALTALERHGLKITAAPNGGG